MGKSHSIGLIEWLFCAFSYVRGLEIVRKKKMIGKMCENYLKNYVVYGIIMSDIKDEVYDLSILKNYINHDLYIRGETLSESIIF